MSDIELEGCILRIRECAFDFMSIEDYIIDYDEDSWDLMKKDLSLRSTFLYLDLNRVISRSSCDDRKRTIADLSNRLFYNIEELSNAVKIKSMSLTQIRYDNAALALQELLSYLIGSPSE